MLEKIKVNLFNQNYKIKKNFLSNNEIKKFYNEINFEVRSIYFFDLNENNHIENEPLRINIGERIRDIAVRDNEYFMFLEDTGSIAKFTIN